MLTERWDMRLTDLAVLKALSNLDKPTSQVAIAEGLGCHPITLNRAIQRLKAKGYVETIGDGRDKPYEGYTIYYDRLPESVRVEFQT